MSKSEKLSLDLSAFNQPSPLRDDQVEALSRTQELYKAMALSLVEACPNSPELEQAIGLLASAKDASDRAIRRDRPLVDASVMGRVFGKIEAYDKRVARVWLNAVDYADVRRYMADHLDEVTKANSIKTGVYGALWGAEVRVSRKIPPGTVCAIPDGGSDEDLKEGWTPSTLDLVRL